MTIIPSLRRPLKRKHNSARTFACESLESRRMLAITIDVGSHTLLPNTAGQVIEITATADEAITGMNFTAQLGDGDSSPSSADEPDFTGVFPGDPTGTDFSGSVWDIPEGIATAPNQLDDDPDDEDNRADAVLIGDNDAPSYVSAGFLVGESIADCTSGGDGNICDITPNGVIVRLEIDTTGFFEDDPLTTFPLVLSGGDPEATTFFRSGSAVMIQPNITNGSITIANTPPVADPVVGNGSYTIDFGGDLALNGSESFDPDESLGDSIASYSWDINSATFANADATGVSPTVSWSQLNGLGISTPGTYDLTLQVSDTFGVTGTATTTVTVEPATVEGRFVFYNNSFYDNNAGAGRTDKNAIATDKMPYIAGTGQASFANYTNYVRGINGILIDVSEVPDGASIDASDFTFRIGNNNDPSTWAVAPTPTSVEVVDGDGVDGTSDAVKITWPDFNPSAGQGIGKVWLEVTAMAGSFGLAQDDVFYFGNAVGDVGNSSSNSQVNSTDRAQILLNPRGFPNFATIDFPFDLDRNRQVNSNDSAIAGLNFTNFITDLNLINIPANLAKTSPDESSVIGFEPTSNKSESQEVIGSGSLTSESEDVSSLESINIAGILTQYRVSELIEIARQHQANFDQVEDSGTTEFESLLDLIAKNSHT